MKILRLLNKKYLSIIIIFFLTIESSLSENQPVDIWNIDKNEIEENLDNKKSSSITEKGLETLNLDVFNMQSDNENDLIKVDNNLISQDLKIVGLYDPEDFGLKIDMWSNSNGDQLKYLFSNLSKLDLSKDASELMNIIMLTNAYYPKKKYQ